MINKLLLGLIGVTLVLPVVPVAVIAFDAPVSPPPMASMAESLESIGSPELPASRQFRARDGAALQYYAYPAATDQVAILIHGSAGPATSMHALAEKLRAAGVTAYVPDIRGHGGSGRRGDIDYMGQIDDDLADFAAELGPARGGETRTLVGFSAGAGFALRLAGGPYGALFDRYVLLSPILPGSAAWRPSAGGWVDIALPRLMTIAYLGRAGIHWFDGSPVIAYAVSRDPARDTTASYSYRLSMNFGAGRAYEAYLKNLRRPAAILVGDADEQVVADQFTPLLRGVGVDIPVTIVPGMKHADMIAKPQALEAAARAIRHDPE
jgi:alpha-beta hydrolase superfamily lysophospholipase